MDKKADMLLELRSKGFPSCKLTLIEFTRISTTRQLYEVK